MFNGYVLYLQAVTTPNPFVKLPKLPFHKSLLLIFCLRLRFPFSFFKLFFAAAALVIFPWWLRLFSWGGLFFRRLWLFSRGGSGYFPAAVTLIILFWTYFYLYTGLCPNAFHHFHRPLQYSQTYLLHRIDKFTALVNSFHCGLKWSHLEHVPHILISIQRNCYPVAAHLLLQHGGIRHQHFQISHLNIS